MNPEKKVETILSSIREVNRVIFQQVWKEENDLNLPAAQSFVLRMIAKNPDIALTELAEMIQVGKSAMSGIVDRLVQAELIERKRSESDRRTLKIKVTQKGEEQAKEIHKFYIKKMEGLMTISEEEVTQLLALHQTIITKLQDGNKSN